jgi:putative ABC transport system permease protein
VRLVRRVAWALLLRAFPADFRRRYGAEMADSVRRARAEVVGGRPAQARFCLGLAADLLAAAVRLRLRPAEVARRSLDQGQVLRGRSLGAVMGSFTVDLQHARRALFRTPGVVALIVCTLGLGIGLTTAVFSVVHGVLLRPFAYAKPHALVNVSGAYVNDGVKRTALAGGTYRAIT